ncbi:nucleotide exchange factor GrpE [Caryophanon latum]|nr:nucleotide exchange factor GrpE [Caryophanon latum]
MSEEMKNEAQNQEAQVAEDVAPAAEEQATEEAVELTEEQKLQAEIDELKAKLEEEENRYLRLRADFDNQRRRAVQDRQAAEKYRAQALLTELLPVLDNFERAMQVDVSSEDAQALYKGVEMVYKTLIAATEQEGLSIIPAVGAEFDPNVHQAVMQESDPEQASGIVLKELQKGYQLKDRVLRPSMVSVNE